MLKKIIALGFILTTSLLSGCDNNTNNEKTITVGVAPGPYGDLFKQAVAPGLKKKGYTVKIREFSDYVQPNIALANKEIDINLFQHLVYLNHFKNSRNLNLTAISFVPTAGAGIYSNKIDSFSQLKAGDQVTISNDATNEARALRILQAAGLIKLNPAVNQNQVTPKDVIENPHKLQIVSIEAPQTPRSLDSATLSVINGNYAISAGIDLATALYSEVLDKDLKNVIAIRTDSISTLGKDILDVVNSEDFTKIINDKSKIFHSFQKPDYKLY